MANDTSYLNRLTQTNGVVLQEKKPAEERSTPARVVTGDIISLHYTGRLEDGTVFITTENQEPFTFTQGQGEVVQAVQQAVLGMALGESKEVYVAEEHAYGPYHHELTIQVGRDEFDRRGIKPEIGLEFGVEQTKGEPLPVRVTEINELSVTLDANHPLAGRSIIFDLLLVDIFRQPHTPAC